VCLIAYYFQRERKKQLLQMGRTARKVGTRCSNKHRLLSDRGEPDRTGWKTTTTTTRATSSLHSSDLIRADRGGLSARFRNNTSPSRRAVKHFWIRLAVRSLGSSIMLNCIHRSHRGDITVLYADTLCTSIDRRSQVMKTAREREKERERGGRDTERSFISARSNLEERV